jgi:hypothetical protein
MKIPKEWIEEALQKICNKEIPISLRPSITRIEKEIDNYLNSDFNSNWEVIDANTIDYFKQFIIQVIVSQCHPYSHSLTCGINSEHASLVPRITKSGVLYLVCPSCGYIQFW